MERAAYVPFTVRRICSRPARQRRPPKGYTRRNYTWIVKRPRADAQAAAAAIQACWAPRLVTICELLLLLQLRLVILIIIIFTSRSSFHHTHTQFSQRARVLFSPRAA